MKKDIIMRINEFRFSEECGKICNDCGTCQIMYLIVFKDYVKDVPFRVING